MLWVRFPLVPVTLSVKFPAGLLADAIAVNVDAAVPPDGSVIGVGSENDTAAGADPTHKPESSTAEENERSDVTVIVALPVEP